MSESTLTETTPATPRPKRRRRWLRRMSITGILLSVTVGTGAGASPFLLHGATEPMAVRDHTDELQVAALSPPRDRLRVVSLNVAHGRGNGFHQLLQRLSILRCLCHPQPRAILQELHPLLLPQALQLHPS